MGVGGQHAAAACGSATRGSAAPARRLIVHWPRGIDASGGEVRDQFVHAIDLMPTDPRRARGRARRRSSTAWSSNRSTARRSCADVHRRARRRHRARCSTSRCSARARSSHDGWKATTDHVSKGVVDEERLLEGSRDFADRRWALFRLDDDFAEARDVAAEHPDVLARLAGAMDTTRPSATRCSRSSTSSSTRGLGLHLSRVSARIAERVPPRREPGDRRVGAVSHRRLPHHRGGRRRVEQPEGVLCALGDWNIGFAHVRGRRIPQLRRQRGQRRHAGRCRRARAGRPGRARVHVRRRRRGRHVHAHARRRDRRKRRIRLSRFRSAGSTEGLD